jgi:gluconolactonase
MLPPKETLTAELFSRMPNELRQVHPTFGRPYLGDAFDSYIEGACFDREGKLFVVDIPHSRVLRITPDGDWSVIASYDGRPKGLSVHRDGRLFVSDNVLGIIEIDPASGGVRIAITRSPYGHLQACNDLSFTPSGDLLVTDQAASSLAEPNGCLFRWRADGRAERLVSNIPGPNGVVANRDETQVFVSATRANAVWNVQLTSEGATERVGIFAHMPGGFGPDGLTLDEAGGLIVAQPGIGVFRFSSRGRATHFIEPPDGDLMTSVAFAPGTRNLYITEASTGSIYRAEMPYEGVRTFAQIPLQP